MNLQDFLKTLQCNSPFPVGRHISRIFAQFLFEKQQAATCRISEEFCGNAGNVPINRKKRNTRSKENSACTFCLQKSFPDSKAFSIQRLITYI
jgi:hypothetical protein